LGLVWNEVSRRYVDYEPEFYVPFMWRGKPENKKQGSSELEMNMILSFGNAVCKKYI
jgi:thymidylate synthase (FAD)